MATRISYLASAAILALAAISAPSAQAAYVVTFEQVGSNVVETGGGSIDFTDLDPIGPQSEFPPSVQPSRGRFFSGEVTGAPLTLAGYQFDGGPDAGAFGSGLFAAADTGSGGPIGLTSGIADHSTIYVPTDYVSGALFNDMSTYLNATLASIGLTPGAYVYSWGSGDHADSLTINIVAAPPAAPEPSTWAMMLVGFAGLGYAVRRKSALRAVSPSRAIE